MRIMRLLLGRNIVFSDETYTFRGLNITTIAAYPLPYWRTVRWQENMWGKLWAMWSSLAEIHWNHCDPEMVPKVTDVFDVLTDHG